MLLQRTWGEAGTAAVGEDDPFVPEPLAARRVDTEHLVRDSARTGVRSIVLRPPMLWGPGDQGYRRALCFLDFVTVFRKRAS